MTHQQLTAALEHEAKQRSQTLETNNKLPTGFTADHYPLTTSEQAALQRLKVALELAQDRDACANLLHGLPVDPSRLHQAALQKALQPGLVQLVRPIDILHGFAARPARKTTE